MPALKDRVSEFSQKFLALTFRERFIILLVVICVIYGVFEVIFFQALDEKKRTVEQRIATENTMLKDLQEKEKSLASALTGNVSSDKRKEIVQLEKQLAAINTQLDKVSVGLVDAEKLPLVLQDVLLASRALTFVTMNIQPPVGINLQEALAPSFQEIQATAMTKNSASVVAPLPRSEQTAMYTKFVGEPSTKKKDANTSNDALENVAGVYRHNVQITLEGTYFSVVNYLKQLERLPWRFYWDSFDYQLQNYPNAKVTLKVYTLSTDKGFIGEP